MADALRSTERLVASGGPAGRAIRVMGAAHDPSRRAALGVIIAAPLAAAPAVAGPSDLAAACDWAAAREAFMDISVNTAGWSDERWDDEYERCGAVYQRAVAEPSASVADVAAKARLVLADLNRSGGMSQNRTAMELCAVVLNEVIGLGV